MGAPKGWDEGKIVTAPPGWDEAAPPPAQPAPPVPSGPEFNPDMYPMDQSAGQVGAKLLRPLLEYGGLAAGAAGGAAAGPVGSVAGAGLGYSAGKGLADLFDEWSGLKAPTSLKSKFVESGKNVVVGAGTEAGGQLLGAGIQAAGQAIAKSGAAQRVYASSVKMPLAQKWVKARGPEGTSNVKTAINKAISENVPSSELGLEMAKTGKAKAADAIDAEISKMTGTYSTDEILQKGLRGAVEKAMRGPAPLKDAERAAQFADDLIQSRQGGMSPTQLNDLKKELYQLANYDKLYGKSDSLIETMRKGVAHEARMQLQASSPALKDLNADYASWRLLEEALERSLARRNNRDIIDLGTKVMIGRESIPLAVLNQIITPNVKSHISFMLKGAGKYTGATVSRPAAYLTVPPATNLLTQ